MANLYDQATQRQKWDQTIDQVQKMGYPQNPAQPPAFAPPPPRQPTSVGTASAATTDQVSQPAAQNAGGMSYGEQMRNVGSALVSLPMEALKTIVSAPGYGFNKPSAPAPAATPVAQNPTDQRIAAGTQAAPLPMPEPAPQPAPVQVGMATTPPLSAGQPSSQSTGAAEGMASRALASAAPAAAPVGMATPVVPNSSNDWAARNNLRNLAVSASSITANGGRFDQSGRGDSPEVSAYKAAVANDFALQQAQPGLAAVAMRENAGIQREGMQQQGANTRSLGQIALEQQKVNQAGEAQGYANRAAGRIESLQTAYQAAKTPAERSALAQQIRAIQGKDDPAEWGVQVTPTTKNIDGSTSMGSIVRYNKATGQTEVVGQGQGSQSPYPEGQKLTGKDGKTYVVKGGVPVPA